MTMYRYIALMWSRTDQEASRAAKFLAAKLHEVSPHAWSQAWDGAGLAIYHSGEHKGRMQTYRLQGERGAVLGRLFRNDYTSVVDDLDEFESRRCLETRSQHLIDNYWGRYVAFLNDSSSGTRYVMRDPTGAFPCFYTPFRGVTIYFSDMQDAANYDFLPFTVNWDRVKAEIMLPQFQKTITGLNEVGEVLPAECVEITPFEKKSRFVWNPTEISQTDIVEDPELAAVLLRETVKNTIGALAGCYDRVVHKLGGFDSSIVLACLAQAPRRPEITCITNYTSSPRGDERYYSRQVAEMYDVELVEKTLDYRNAELSRIFKSNKLANPLGFLDCKGLIDDVLALTKERGAEAITYGVGGDQVFLQYPSNFGALDYVRQHGIDKTTIEVAIEASRYGRVSLFRTIREMLSERISPASCYEYVLGKMFEEIRMPLVNPELYDASDHDQYLHPLLRPENQNLKGKYLHVFCCALFLLDYYDHWDTNYIAERVNAFFAQPIIETCLRIPVWVLTYGGIDRGLARLAFKEDLPTDIVLRRTKSTPSEYYKDIFDRNLGIVREILLDGILAQKGLLRRDKLENVLSKSDIFQHIWPSQVLGYLAMDIWIKSWMDRPITKPDSIKTAV